MLDRGQLIHKITNNCREIEDKAITQAQSTSNLHIKKFAKTKNRN
jgi:hypothetical protein